jgi:hypothetical protein
VAGKCKVLHVAIAAQRPNSRKTAGKQQAKSRQKAGKQRIGRARVLANLCC